LLKSFKSSKLSETPKVNSCQLYDGEEVGVDEGTSVGETEGTLLGLAEGDAVGDSDGLEVGLGEGLMEIVGLIEGIAVGG
jgi:hypothetical protein